MARSDLDYKVVEAPSAEELALLVRNELRKDYLPQGGVVIVALGDDQYLYAQSLVRNV